MTAIPKNAIQLCSGKYIDLMDPQEAEFTIEDIAHALGRICRFTGHCRDFYSVAQHSVIVSGLVPHRLAMDGLLHDAAEAFIGDVSTPLKALIPDYRIIQRMWEKELAVRFGLTFPEPAEVKAADRTVMVTEKRDLLPGEETWPGYEAYPKLPRKIIPWSPERATREFLTRYHNILRVTDIAI